jgi:iron-sulfur cluster repair protein YtfE (RIC family)
MNVKQAKHAELVQRIHEEHVAVARMTANIRRKLDELRDRPESSVQESDLPELVRELQRHLVRHFRLEETGGLLSDAVQAPHPGSLRKVEELVAQHRDFERRLARILAELDGGIAPPRTVRECFDRDLRGLFAELDQHEQLENDMLQALVVRDTGRVD